MRDRDWRRIVSRDFVNRQPVVVPQRDQRSQSTRNNGVTGILRKVCPAAAILPPQVNDSISIEGFPWLRPYR